MAHNKAAVQQILDKAKADGRTSLTAPEGKLRVRRVRHHRAEGRRRHHGGRGGEARRRHGLPGGAEDRVAGNPAQDRSGRRARRRQERGRRRSGLRDDHGQREEVRRQGQPAGRAGAADGHGRPGSHHRRRDRSVVRQAGGVRAGRHPRRGAEGHHVPAGPRHEGRCAVDAGRHRRGVDPEGRARQRSGEPRRARGADRERVAARVRLPADRGDGPEPGVRVEGGRDRRRRAHRARLHAAGGALSPEPGRDRRADEQGDEAGCGGGDRRVRRDRQDRQLGDEEPDQRRLQGQDLPDQPVRRQDHGTAGVQERQGRARRHRHRGVRDPRQVRAAAH